MSRAWAILGIWCALATLATALAGTYPLLDGSSISGQPIGFNEAGVILKSPEGTIQPRVPWARFTQESLKSLRTEAKKTETIFIDPFIEEVTQARARNKEIVIRPPPRFELPTGRKGFLSLFISPLGIFLLALAFVANLWAAYQVAGFRQAPASIVCGSAVLLPGIAPAVFLFLPTQIIIGLRSELGMNVAPPPAPVEEAPLEESPAPAPESEASPEITAPTPAPAPRPAPRSPAAPRTPQTFSVPVHQELEESPDAVSTPFPPTVTFARGEFTFNRRFFETKMPGFFRVIPSEAEKDLYLQVQAARGTFLGKRISKITQSELHLEIFKEQATAEEMIPFTEIQEVQIRHRDSL